MILRWTRQSVRTGILCVAVFLVEIQPVFAWSVPTHQSISDRAAHVAVLNTGLLPQLGFTNPSTTDPDVEGIFLNKKSVSQWIQVGAKFEDQSFLIAFGRFYNHFHNPLCQAPWTGCQAPWPNAGLHDSLLGIPVNGESALLWAQNSGLSDQSNTDWSWQAVRQYYYNALTATTVTDRDGFFAKTFEGIGHVIHLVQDMSQPAHVRNDAHPIDGTGQIEGLETWAVSKAGSAKVAGFLAAAPTIPPLPQGTPVPTMAPITQFWDTDRYDGTTATLSLIGDPNIGLAEYTNASYFSDDTIAAPAGDRHHFNLPSSSISDYTPCADTAPPGSQGQSRWYLGRVSKTGGVCSVDPAAIDHFIAGSFLPSPQPGQISPSLVLDAKVHEDYSRDLVPRAVGYSVGLINYFFRGKIELSLPDRGVYAITDPTTGFTNFRIKAKNVSTLNPGSSTIDAMTDGNIQLVLRYRLAQADPFQGIEVARSPQFSYIIVPPTDANLRTIPSDTSVELEFDLSSSPLPLWATDLYAYLVYRGVLGDEQDAVAVGYKDISEPTPVDFINLMDYICLNGAFFLAGSQQAIDQVGVSEGRPNLDIYPHNVVDDTIKFSPIDAGQAASSSLYNVTYPVIPPGAYGRVYLLTDYSDPTLPPPSGGEPGGSEDDFNESDAAMNVPVEGYNDPFTHTGFPNTIYPFTAVRNQDTQIGGITYHYYPAMITIRGLPGWGGSLYTNAAWGSTSGCADLSGQPDLIESMPPVIP